MSTKCKFCGSNSYGDGCEYSPNGKHEHISDNLGKALFFIMRYMVLETKLNNRTAITDASAHAWNVGLYPIWGKEACLEPFKEFFIISEEKCSRVLEFVMNESLEKRYYNFHDIEKHFESEEKDLGVDRTDLIEILRYAFLGGRIGNDFLSKLLEPCGYPSGATHIEKEFDLGEILFVEDTGR